MGGETTDTPVKSATGDPRNVGGSDAEARLAVGHGANRDERRAPLHPSISTRQISELVDRFYDAVWADPVLGPVFVSRVGERRAEHLQRMKLFWSSVLLKSGAYKGRPVPAHVKLSEVRSDDFRIWLSHFRTTANTVFAPEAAPVVIEAAERIAASLWLAMFGSPFTNVPDWQSPPAPVAPER